MCKFMKRILKAEHLSANECEVTGEVSRRSDASTMVLDGDAVGRKLFPDSRTEWLDGDLRLESVTPSGAVIVSSGNERFVVTEGEVFRTASYTLDGRHCWRYVFEIVREE